MLTVAVLFAAALLHAMLGFGTALVAMPLLAMTLGVRTATPLVGLAMLTIIATLLARQWRSVDIAAARSLVIASLFGAPLGVFVLSEAPEAWVRGALGLLLILFAAYGLTQPRFPSVERRAWAYLFGFTAGALGAAYNTNGPPLLIYGTMRRWPPDRFRATLQGFFLPADVIICASHAASGFWTKEVWSLYLTSLPGIFLGLTAGVLLARRVQDQAFARAVYVAAGLLGLRLLV